VLHDHLMIGTNWSGTYTYRAGALHRPRTMEELQDLVGSGRQLHAVGTRHSFNDVADGAALISVADLPGEMIIDDRAQIVRVPAATRYGDLAARLQSAGWALGNLASLPHISVAGSVATATHGSGNRNQTLAAAVTGMTLINGTGELVAVDRGHPDFPGAVVHLGALGVVTELTLAVEPTFDVRQDVYRHLPWDQLRDSFEDVLGAGYSVSAITDFAGDDLDLLWVKTRVGPSTGAGRDSTGSGTGGDMPATLFGATAATEKLHMTRGNDPRFCTPQLGEVGPWSDRLAHFLLEFTPSSGAEIQSEYLMDRVHGPAVVEALRGLGGVIAPLVKSAEIRTVAADDLWLSPAYQRDIFGVHFTWQPDAAAVTSAVAEIEQTLSQFSPRPHWAKVFGDGFDWAALYPRLGDFRSLAQRYDPNGVFRTGLVSRTILSS
jgi:alditol oxidase